jgi:hypothetical protein
MGSPPGLSIAQAERVSGKQPFKSDVLAMRKVTFILSWGDYLQILADVLCTRGNAFSLFIWH